MTDRSDLRQLTMLLHPFPPDKIRKKPGGAGGDYVAHGVVEQRLIDVLGAPPDTEILREVFDEDGTLTGCVMRMTTEVDGLGVTVVEAGDCENPQVAKTNGARLKNAASDAYKRCAMRLGVGLHLWAQDDFYLADKLLKADLDGADQGDEE